MKCNPAVATIAIDLAKSVFQVLAVDAPVADFAEAEVAETPGLGRRDQHPAGFELALQPVQPVLDEGPADAPAAFLRGNRR